MVWNWGGDVGSVLLLIEILHLYSISLESHQNKFTFSNSNHLKNSLFQFQNFQEKTLHLIIVFSNTWLQNFTLKENKLESWINFPSNLQKLFFSMILNFTMKEEKKKCRKVSNFMFQLSIWKTFSTFLFFLSLILKSQFQLELKQIETCWKFNICFIGTMLEMGN